MRTKMLAASIVCVVCTSGTATYAGGRDTIIVGVAEELAVWAGWMSRSSTAAEITALRNLQRLETVPLTRQFGTYHNVYEAPSLGQSNDLFPQVGVRRPELGPLIDKRDLFAPAQDSATDQSSKSGRLIGGSITTGGTACVVWTDCPRTILKMKD